MDRRTFLGTIVGGVVANPLEAAGAQNEVRGLGNSVPSAVNFAGKVKGLNLTTRPGKPLLSFLWSAWDWDGWIRPQLDVAVAIGANAVRLQGDVTVVHNGTLSQAAYNARTQQFASYCVAHGLAIYYTGCATFGTDGIDNGTTALPDTAIATIISSNLDSITGASGAPDYTASIIGADLVQEADANRSGISAARVNNIYSLVRPNAPSVIGCTFSTYQAMPNTTWLNSIIKSCDFLDFHIYPTIYGINSFPSSDAVSRVLAAFPGKDVLFGEGGADGGQYASGQVTSWNTSFAGIGDLADPRVRGALLWAAQDQGPPGHLMGIVDGNWYPRAATAGPWLKWCRLSYLPAPRSLPDAATIRRLRDTRQ